MWFDTTNSQLYVDSGTSWILIGPTSIAGSGITAMVSAVVESTLGTNKNVLKGNRYFKARLFLFRISQVNR